MPYIIDGYNLLHALGLLRGRAGPHGLEKARLALLGLLRGALGERAGEVAVVFDARGARPDAAEASDFGPIRVLFAVRQQEADDLIEDLIRRDPDPRRLQVVSDDRRLQQAARRRRAQAVGCLDFLTELHRQRRTSPEPPSPPEKSERLSAPELAQWMQEFADLADDPAFRELFEPYNFDEPRP